jgi:tripartite ATP-independent transporter DctP family solute receptor
MKRLCTFVVVLTLSVLAAGVLFAGGQAESGAKAPIVLKGGHNGTPEHLFHIAWVKWAEAVKEKTNGQVLIEIYPNEQLGNEQKTLDDANLGITDMALVGAGAIAKFEPIFGMFENAYTFKSAKHYENVAYNREFLAKLDAALQAKSNIVLMPGFVWLGNRSVLSTKPINKPEDAKGLKLRVPPTPTYEVVAYACGFTAAPIAFGETYMALKQGVVDAVEGTPENMVKMRFCEAAKYYTLTEHMRQGAMIIMSKKAFYEKLNKQQQKIVTETFYDVFRNWHFAENAKVQEEFLTKLEKEEGVTVIRLSSTDAFRNRALEKLQKDYIPKWGKWWDEFMALAE